MPGGLTGLGDKFEISQALNVIFYGFYLLYSTGTSRPPSCFVENTITVHAHFFKIIRMELHEVFQPV